MQPANGPTDPSFKFLLFPQRTENVLVKVQARSAYLQNNPNGSLEVCFNGGIAPAPANGSIPVPELTVGENIQWSSSSDERVRKLSRAPFKFVKEQTPNGCSVTVQFKNCPSLRIDGLVLNREYFNPMSRRKVIPLTPDELDRIDFCVAHDSAQKLHLLVLRPNSEDEYVLTAYSEKPKV